MNSQSLYFRCRYLHSILLVVATGFAILQPHYTDAQLPEDLMPRAVLKSGHTPDKKNFSQFQFSPDGKLLATWSIAPGGAAGVFGFGSGGGGDCRPFNFKLWDVSTAEELMKVIEVFGGFAFSPDSKALLICDGMGVQIRDISTGDNG